MILGCGYLLSGSGHELCPSDPLWANQWRSYGVCRPGWILDLSPSFEIFLHVCQKFLTTFFLEA